MIWHALPSVEYGTHYASGLWTLHHESLGFGIIRVRIVGGPMAGEWYGERALVDAQEFCAKEAG